MRAGAEGGGEADAGLRRAARCALRATAARARRRARSPRRRAASRLDSHARAVVERQAELDRPLAPRLGPRLLVRAGRGRRLPQARRLPAGAAIGREQLRKLASFVAARRENWRVMRDRLRQYDEFLVLPEALPDSEPSPFAGSPSARTRRSRGPTSPRGSSRAGPSTRTSASSNNEAASADVGSGAAGLNACLTGSRSLAYGRAAVERTIVRAA